MRFNPENSGTVSSFSLNGGGGGVAVYLNHWIGIQAEFQGYASTTQTFHFTGSVPPARKQAGSVRAAQHRLWRRLLSKCPFLEMNDDLLCNPSHPFYLA